MKPQLKKITSLVGLTIGLVILLYSCKEEEHPAPNKTSGPIYINSEIKLSDDLQDALDRGLKEYGGKGIAVSIYIPEIGYWYGVSGVSHADVPITRDMAFSAGSITKTFTAVTILQLVDEGELDLDDPIHKHLGNYPFINPDITIRQLLNHTSGIFNVTENPAFWSSVFTESNTLRSIDETINKFNQAPYYSKGSGWHYSNTGYNLLKLIIKNVTGNDLAYEYRTRIFNRYDLDKSFLIPEELMPEKMAHGWFDLDNDGDYDDFSIISPNAIYSSFGGIVCTTALDLAKWANALYSEGTVLNTQLLTEMLDFYSPCPDEEMVDGYGLGAIRYNPQLFNGLDIWGHGGDAPGYAAASLYVRGYGVSIGIMANTEKGETMHCINDLLEIVTSYLDR